MNDAFDSAFNSWGKLIVWIRVVGALLGIVVMSISLIVSREGRAVRAAGLVLLVLILVHQSRAIRKWRQGEREARSDENNVDYGQPKRRALRDAISSASSQIRLLSRLNVVIIAAQLGGGVLYWVLTPEHNTLASLWIGAALAAGPGLVIGLLVQRIHSDQWMHTGRNVRLLYLATAGLLTCAGLLCAIAGNRVLVDRIWV